jgi:hypothetical protein
LQQIGETLGQNNVHNKALKSTAAKMILKEKTNYLIYKKKNDAYILKVMERT